MEKEDQIVANLFFCYTPHSVYERQMQTVPRFGLAYEDRKRQKLIQNHIRLLGELILELELAQARNRIERAVYTYFGDEDEMFFYNNVHRTSFYDFRRKAEENKWPIMKKNHCIAAVYLLTAHDFFIKEMPRILGKGRISLSRISVKNANEEIYNIYQAARFLCDGEDKLWHEDLTEQGILSDKVTALIMNAFIINKYGFKAMPTRSFRAFCRNRRDSLCLV